MANDLNRVTLIGRLTRDPEIKTVGGTSVCNFSLATNRTYVSNGEKKEETHFFDCDVWGKLADVLKQYATKGKQLAIEGRLQQSVWDAPDGKKNSKVRIRVENFQLLGGNTGGGSADELIALTHNKKFLWKPMIQVMPQISTKTIPFFNNLIPRIKGLILCQN